MNLSTLTSFIVVLLALTFIGCSNTDQDAVRAKAREAIPASATPAAAPAQTASVNSGVAHYICKNNCIGSGGDAQGNCPVCGEAYEHNAAYHNNPTAAAPADAGSTTQSYVPPGAPADPNPAQNSAGVWHYSCAKGCAGGSAGAGTCSTCGEALAHNPDYHN